MLEELEFEKDLREFCEKWQNFGNETPWKICESEFGIYGTQSKILEKENEVIVREAHIVYNNIYKVPVLWFNFFKRDGQPLRLIELSTVMNISPGESQSSIMTRISHNEHPHLGVLYFNIHPCNTASIMSELNLKNKIEWRNYISSWLSIYGAEIGISLPVGFI